MPVHTKRDRLQVITMVFEARFEDGFLLLDHMGKLATRIRRDHRDWALTRVSQNLLTLRKRELDLVLHIGVEKMDISVSGAMTPDAASKHSRLVGESAEQLYGLTIEIGELFRTSRVGARFAFLAPSDNLEEADRFARNAAVSPMLDAVANRMKCDAIEAHLLYTLIDTESGYRRRVQIGSVITEQKPEGKAYAGFPDESGSGGVLVDIDTYTRSDEGHFYKISQFVQDNYLRSEASAVEIFSWLLQQQKLGRPNETPTR